MFGMDIGIDLGTATILIYLRGKGIVLQEPSVVAINSETKQILAVGEEARRMLGRTPGSIEAIRPMREGVIADYAITEELLKRFIAKVGGTGRLMKPRVMVCIPSGITSVEKRAVIQAAKQAGAKEAYLIEEPIAAALGAGLDISEPSGSMVIDIGGGTTDIAVISLNGIVVSASLRVGGDKFDDAITRYMKKAYNLLIGERTAENVKIATGTALPDIEELYIDVRGRDMISGLPKTVRVTSSETYEALKDNVNEIVESVRAVLDKTPPELASDIIEKGIVLTGGGALLRHLDKRISDETGIPVFVAEQALNCVALGTGKALEGLDSYSMMITKE